VIENEGIVAPRRSPLHTEIVYRTLYVSPEWNEDAVQDVIADIDDRIVRSAEPFRDDFVVTVWRGEETGVYSDEQRLADPAGILPEAPDPAS